MTTTSESLGPENRVSPRYEITAPAYVDSVGGEVFLNQKLLNLSLGGLCLRCDAAEEIGTVVDLVVHFPELGTSVAARGQVIWANRTHPCDIGVKFIGMDERRLETLRQYIGRIQSAQEQLPASGAPAAPAAQVAAPAQAAAAAAPEPGDPPVQPA